MPVYFYIVQSSVLNRHTHFYANGLVITHSHNLDLNENNPNDHEHSQTEICLFSYLNIDLHTLTTENLIDFSDEVVGAEFIVSDIQFKKSSTDSHLIPRGPPVL